MSSNGAERQGWISLHRTIIDSKLWSCSDATFRVAIYLLIEANHKPAWHRRVWIERGQTARSITRISDDCNLSRKAVRYALETLRKDGFIVVDEPFGAQQGHRITVCKYDTYQKDNPNRGTGGAHEGSNEGNTNNKEYNVKNVRQPSESEIPSPSETAGLSEDFIKQIVAKYNALASELSLQKVKAVNTERKKGVNARYKDGMIEHLDTIFEKIRASEFLQGIGGRASWNGADFDWLFKSPHNWIKVIEGKYDQKAQKDTRGLAPGQVYQQENYKPKF